MFNFNLERFTYLRRDFTLQDQDPLPLKQLFPAMHSQRSVGNDAFASFAYYVTN